MDQILSIFSHNNISSVTSYPSYFNPILYMDISFSGLQYIDNTFFTHLANRKHHAKVEPSLQRTQVIAKEHQGVTFRCFKHR